VVAHIAWELRAVETSSCAHESLKMVYRGKLKGFIMVMELCLHNYTVEAFSWVDIEDY
jgi:hypothetical protein